MAFSICKLKNKTGALLLVKGHEFQIDEEYTIQDTVRLSWASSDEVITNISQGNLEVNDCCGPLEGISAQLDYLKSPLPTEMTVENTNKYSLQMNAVSATCLPQTSTKITIKMENFDNESYDYKYLWSSSAYCVGADMGDYCEFQITDEDNIYGLGAGAVIKEYVKKIFVFSNHPMEIKCFAPGQVPVGLYLTCIYHNVSLLTTAKFYINYQIYTRD